jgi:predicted metal-dependent peptidase
MSKFRDQVGGQEKEMDPEVIKASEHRMGITKARLLLQHPFYGVLLSMTDFIHEGVIPTMATDGSKVYFNAEFVKALSDDEVYAVLLHEISHCIYLHCTQKRRMNREHKRWNVATDFAINLEIKDMGFKLPKDVLLDEKYRNMNAEQIYDALPQDVSKYQTLDIHIEDSDESSWDDMEDKILTAYEMTKNSKSKGDVPAGIKNWIDKMRKSKVKWERIFHKYVGQAVSKDDFSYARVQKRMVGQDIYLPSLHSHSIGSVIIAIDTSGSIDKKQLEQFAAEINKIRHLVNELTCITCDAVVHEVVKIDKFTDFTKKLKFLGGGGTSHQPVFKKIKELKVLPELFIGLTDMYSDIDSIQKPPYPVIWCSTSEISKAKFGVVVNIPK